MTLHRTALAVVSALALAACTTEKITYVTRAPFNPPPDAAAGFLGYFTVSNKQTTCGNCHVGHQTSWSTTLHARAWSDLQASGHASAACNNCHTVSQLGNRLGKAGGYSVVPDSAYHDVQCESCHGPGTTHATNPDVVANRPLASIRLDTGSARVVVPSSCGGCHTSEHEPFVDQWLLSAHGSGPGYAIAAANASCAPCHEGKAAIAIRFGDVNANYLEKTDTTHLRIVCVVCHNPHGSPYEHQLRASESDPTTDNLCIKCHSRAGTPPWGVATATRGAGGPHGAQGLLVIGQNVGWIPPNFTYDTNNIVGSHGTSQNPRLCATCHVVRTTITDAATGAFQFQSVGHLFDAIPCTDANGIPVPGTCALAQRDFSGCVSSGCHANRTAVVSAYTSEIGTLDNQLDQIWTDLNSNAIIDSTDGGLLPQLVKRAQRPGATASDTAQLDFGSTTTTVAKGTLYNAALAATDDRPQFLSGKVLGKGWAAHASSGNGVHNPFLLEALLTSSIAALHTTYSLTPPPNFDLRIRATPPPGLRTRATSN
jgi:predicted CXXCH cytochrome family protein